MAKKAVEKVDQGSENIESSLRMYSTWITQPPSQVLGKTVVLTSILKRIEHVEYKEDRMEKDLSSRLDKMDEKLGQLEESYPSINALARTI